MSVRPGCCGGSAATCFFSSAACLGLSYLATSALAIGLVALSRAHSGGDNATASAHPSAGNSRIRRIMRTGGSPKGWSYADSFLSANDWAIMGRVLDQRVFPATEDDEISRRSQDLYPVRRGR